MKMVKVVLTGKAVCTFVRTMVVPEDEVEDLVSDDETIACNLDDPNSAFDIERWEDVSASAQGPGK